MGRFCSHIRRRGTIRLIEYSYAYQVKPSGAATLAQLAEFSEIIDTRTPAEFAEDHIPGAINLPVLDNEERIRVGTLHKQASPFEAKKVGAALVSRHIAEHIAQHFLAMPSSYRPLVYCWRGGNRSGSMTHVLQRIGFKAMQLEGGYKTYRRSVIEALDALPPRFEYRVICGPTGCGKSRLLQVLENRGAQVLDLEAFAAHRGSLLGNLPDQSQPSQKSFESRIWDKLRRFDPGQPVYVESESKKIGKLRVPETLLASIRQGSSLWIDADMQNRVALLLEEYAHFLDAPETLLSLIGFLTPLRGTETIERWINQIRSRQWSDFVRDMLENHYDPAYEKSLARNYDSGLSRHTLRLTGISANDFDMLASQIVETTVPLAKPH